MSLKPVDIISPEILGKKGGPSFSLEFVIKILNTKGSAAGFRELRDFLLRNAETLKDKISLTDIINLAMRCDKHATFSNMAEDTTKEKDRQQRFAMLQGWLQSGEPMERENGEGEDGTFGVSDGEEDGESRSLRGTEGRDVRDGRAERADNERDGREELSE